MIDGVYPSQFISVEAMRTSHYRNLKCILNSTSSPRMSWLSPEYRQMSTRKKINHQNWRIFTKNQQQSQLYKRNTNIYDKLKKISSSNSRYRIKTQPQQSSKSRDRLLHHNYIYECDRRYQSIEKDNKLIISRLSNAKSQFDHKKQHRQFIINKCNVSRLEKFQRMKRLNRLVSRNLREKFMGNTLTSFKISNPELREA